MLASRARPSVRSSALSVMSIGRGFSTAAVPRMATTAGGSADHKGPWADRPASAGLNRYMVVAEDYTDAGANARRLEVRERHLEQARNGKGVGRIELGGALLKKDFDQIDEEVGPGPILGGSVLIVLGESIEDVRTRVMQDEYVQGNVWDLSKLKIYPFLQAPLIPASASEPLDSQAMTDAVPAATLGQLRQDAQEGKGPKIVTLGSLRKMHNDNRPTTP